MRLLSRGLEVNEIVVQLSGGRWFQTEGPARTVAPTEVRAGPAGCEAAAQWPVAGVMRVWAREATGDGTEAAVAECSHYWVSGFYLGLK